MTAIVIRMRQADQPKKKSISCRVPDAEGNPLVDNAAMIAAG